MKDFATGLTYLRSCALAKGLIGNADNDDILVERLAGLITESTKGGREKAIAAADPLLREAFVAEEDEPPTAEGADVVPTPDKTA